MKILVCFGTRPEAIKMAPVIHELQKWKLNYKICVTGQHREMLAQVLDFFEIRPDYNLDLMKDDQTLNGLGSTILQEVDKILEIEKPDLILVQGDTSTAVFAAMAAFHREIKIGHIEAGLRTYNKKSPFPEEMNRQLISRMANFHFAPTFSAKKNLLNENIAEEGILITGNTIVDALEYGKTKIEGLSKNEVSELTGVPLEKLEKFILVTGHRRENFGLGLENICSALETISKTTCIIFPVHLNPNVSGYVKERLEGHKNIHLIKPVTYPVILWLMKNSEFIISDSGGIQEEAPSFCKNVLVTRNNSERLEGINSNFAKLVGNNPKKIIDESNIELKNRGYKNFLNPYGDGKASLKIVDFLNTQFG